MSTILRRFGAVMLWLCTFAVMPRTFAQTPTTRADYEKDWQRAESAMAKGLPQSALTIANQLYSRAKAERNYPQLVKATMYGTVYRSFREDDAYPEIIRGLRADIADAPEPARSVMQSVLGELYWHYFQQNRGKLTDRSRIETDDSASSALADTTKADSDDLRTWDAARLLTAATAAWDASLTDVARLQKTPLADYEVILQPGDVDGRTLRPTLFDLLAHRALAYYQNSEADLFHPTFRFEIDQPDFLATPDVFAKIPVQTADVGSLRARALRLYQQLVAFHLTDKDARPLADVDVLRLAFVQQYATVSDKDSLYRQTLTTLTDRYQTRDGGDAYGQTLAEWLVSIGNQYKPLDATPVGKWELKQAVDLARNVAKRWPNSRAGRKATLLVADQTKPRLDMKAEEINVPGLPFRVWAEYRNLPRVFVRVVQLKPGEVLTMPNNNSDNKAERPAEWLRAVLARPERYRTQFALPDDGDLHQHALELPMNALPTGQYALLLSPTETITTDTDLLTVTTTTVSRMGYLMGSEPDKRREIPTLFVLDRQLGQPLAKVRVEFRYRSNSYEQRNDPEQVVRLFSDEQGRVKVPMNTIKLDNLQYYFRLILPGDTLETDKQGIYLNSNYIQPEEEEQDRQLLFTDRAIYRPGQPIYVKGILYRGKNNNVNVVPNQEVKVSLRDANYEAVSTLTLTTNAFGTFDGSFVAPVGRLTGRMTIETDVNINSSQEIRVEEYKRPTFTVAFDTLKTAVRLGQPVMVSAVAKTFAGAVVDGASVRYRVTRTYVQPWGWGGWWRQSVPVAQPTEISSGTLTTNTAGTASLTFTAEPDRTKDRADSPFFTYEIFFDVTDRAGETRSATESLRIGYTALVAELPIPSTLDKSDPATVRVRAVNATEQAVAASGQLTIWRLMAPTKPLRARLWEQPDRQFLPRAEFEKLFPNDLYANDDQPSAWPKGPQVQQVVVATSPQTLTLNTAQFEPGQYQAELTLTDPKTGDTVTQRQFFSLTDEAKRVALPRVDTWFQAKQTTVNLSKTKPTGEAVFLLGNTQPGFVLMSVERDHKLTQQTWLQTDGTLQRVTIPVTEADRGGFVVFFTMVQNGRIYTEQTTVSVPFTNKNLTIETLTFRDKLRPGQTEQWTLRVSGPDKDKVLAEMVATLYDASLDAFVPHNWPAPTYSTYVAGFNGWQSQAFGQTDGRTPFYQYRSIDNLPSLIYPELTWRPYSFSGGSRLFYRPSGTYTQERAGKLTIRLQRAGRQVIGTITDADKRGQSDIIITVKGTNKGTTSNRSGRFVLTLPDGEAVGRLVFSSFGYTRLEIAMPIGRRTVYLLEDVSMLNEVIVVGYGISKQRDVMRHVAMMAAPMDGQLQGRLAGVAVADSVEPNGVKKKEGNRSEPADKPETPKPEVQLRHNFNETAFFFPKLQTDAEGRVLLNFTLPDALTRWRLLTFAHTQTMQTGSLEREIVAQKELMITANAPRFAREGDTIRLTARVNNLTDRPLSGTATLALSHALTGQAIDSQFKNVSPIANFSIPAGQSAPVSWTVVVPTGVTDIVNVKMVASAGLFTDGEERPLPVLPNRMLVLDSQPFWINGNGHKTVRLEPLANLNPATPGTPDGVQHERLTVEVTSNPAWYALQALPYVLEYPFECTEQLASRLYANALAAYVVNAKPAFRAVIDAWAKNPPMTPLAKNPELKAVALTETPWVAEAKSEAEQQARLGQLFDQNRLTNDMQQGLAKLKTRQLADGGFVWFAGMKADPTMTLHLLATFGHLTKLGATLPADLLLMMKQATQFVDADMVRWVREDKKSKTPTYGSYWASQYLYARSFYPQWPIADKSVQTYLQKTIASHWLDQSLAGQAMNALTLHRFGDHKTAMAILASLRERATLSDELGMYWAENKSGFRWYQAPVETQALQIEVFTEIANDQVAVDDLKRWLIRQKQTQSWSSTKATTEAVYALLLNGSNWLSTSVNTTVRVGTIDLGSRASKADIATGYQKTAFVPAEITPALGTVQIDRTGNGPAWGAMYWQHFEPLDRVGAGQPTADKGLSVQKTLFRQKDTPNGPVLTVVTDKTMLKPGDLLKVRVVLKTDRLMEYVHLKDSRAAGFEPVAVLSGYKYQNGLGYYEAPRDTGTDFFLSEVPVGTHVFEYSLRVNHMGQFAAGVATVQCFYAPEFSAHSAGSRVSVGGE